MSDVISYTPSIQNVAKRLVHKKQFDAIERPHTTTVHHNSKGFEG